MKIKKHMKNAIGKRATRRVYSALPWIGAALAVGAGTVASRTGALANARARGRAILNGEREQHDSE